MKKGRNLEVSFLWVKNQCRFPHDDMLDRKAKLRGESRGFEPTILRSETIAQNSELKSERSAVGRNASKDGRDMYVYVYERIFF